MVARVTSRTASVGDHASVVPEPDGRLWVMWEKRSQRLYATRSNRAATWFGAVVEVNPPAGTGSIWKAAGDGALGRLDLVATPGQSCRLCVPPPTRIVKPTDPSRLRSNSQVV